MHISYKNRLLWQIKVTHPLPQLSTAALLIRDALQRDDRVVKQHVVGDNHVWIATWQQMHVPVLFQSYRDSEAGDTNTRPVYKRTRLKS